MRKIIDNSLLLQQEVEVKPVDPPVQTPVTPVPPTVTPVEEVKDEPTGQSV